MLPAYGCAGAAPVDHDGSMPAESHAENRPAFHPETVAVTAGRPPHDIDEPLNVPVHFVSNYIAGGEREYGRFTNPSWTAFEDALGALEGGRCVSFASGMAAISAVLDLVPTGGVVVAPRHSYNGTVGQFTDRAARGAITVRYVDIEDADAVTTAAAGAALVWIESPTNPALEIADIAAITAASHEAGALVAVDNTFATPMLQRPFEHDADIVVHSATKYIAGHSDVLMGAVLTRDDALHTAIVGRRTLQGGIPSPLDSFLALRGLRTLPLRVERSQASAAELARRLADHPGLDEVRYPGFGGILAIVVRGGADAADAAIARANLWVHATSLGGVESTWERRRRWSAEPESIPAGLIRLSVGLEHVDDLYADLVRCLS